MDDLIETRDTNKLMLQMLLNFSKTCGAINPCHIHPNRIRFSAHVQEVLQDFTCLHYIGWDAADGCCSLNLIG